MKSVTIRHRPLLLVEDNPDVREAIRTLLSLEGYMVVTANNGEHALTALRSGLQPCLIILDLAMPGTDGYQFRSEQMRDASIADIPVIICSGTRDVADAAETLGVAGYYHKPIEVEEFLDLVARHC